MISAWVDSSTTKTTKIPPKPKITEDKIKELIVHLVQVNQTERACEVIEVLRKYVAEQTLNGYKLK